MSQCVVRAAAPLRSYLITFLADNLSPIFYITKMIHEARKGLADQTVACFYKAIAYAVPDVGSIAAACI